MSDDLVADVVVVGAGVAGAAVALAAAAEGRRVTLLVKGELGAGASRWAQGGLAAVLHPDDSPRSHVHDTLEAGVGLCDPEAVTGLVSQAPQAVARLAAMGAVFDRAAGRLALGREGGHQHHRIVHAGGDASGREIMRVLVAALQESDVRVREQVTVTDVLLDEAGQAAGVDLLDESGRPLRLTARAVVLATGGAGQAYASTTNPEGATGDGLGLALRAGATVLDAEFVQFHPTALWSPGGTVGGQRPLVTEALRGAGATLLDRTGRRVMAGVHPREDLAPRDVVSAGLHARMLETGSDHVYLDATALGAERLERSFPTVVAACREIGVDPAHDPIPVVPAAHYQCGGVRADLEGRTDVAGLYAVGEVARTGVHGANRLASNSLSEALVSGFRAGRTVARELPVQHGSVTAPPSLVTVDPAARPTIAGAMSAHAGVLRDAVGLDILATELAATRTLRHSARTRAEVEATSLHLVARLVTAAARTRTESRGCHRRSDFPDTDPCWQSSVALRWCGGSLRATVTDRRAAA